MHFGTWSQRSLSTWEASFLIRSSHAEERDRESRSFPIWGTTRRGALPLQTKGTGRNKTGGLRACRGPSRRVRPSHGGSRGRRLSKSVSCKATSSSCQSSLPGRVSLCRNSVFGFPAVGFFCPLWVEMYFVLPYPHLLILPFHLLAKRGVVSSLDLC